MEEQDDLDQLLRSIEQELNQRRDLEVSWSSGSLAVLSIYLVRVLLPDDPLLQKSPDELLNPPGEPEKTHTVKQRVRALQVIESFKHDFFSCASDYYSTVIQARFRPNRRLNVTPD